MNWLRLAVLSASIAAPSGAWAAGFEVGSNTALSNARGGTGVASKSDPSAATINPGRLPFAPGLQIIGGSNVVDLNLKFQRDPLVRPIEVVEFEEVENVSPPFIVPYLAVSWDLGIENFAVAVSASGPHAYGSRCFSEIVDGECVVDYDNAARHMIVQTDLIQVYFLATVAYALEIAGGKLGFGLSGGPTYQESDLTLIIDQASLNIGPPYIEDPESQSAFRGRKLRDIKPAFVGGVAWEGADGIRLAAAYQPGIKWSADGVVELDLPPAIRDLTELTDDGLVLETSQAHRATFGVGYAKGVHPNREELPLFDVEFNVVWEDWGRVDAFTSRPSGSLDIADGVQQLPINPVNQPKDYEDTFALRAGGSYALGKALSLHLGAFLETAAQRKALTNADFASWERYSGSFGTTVHIGSWLDITASYAYVGSPSRTVTEGEVYSQIPLSSCQYPNFDQPSCESPGQPPGNPQNEGTWSNHFHIAGLNFTGKF